MNTEIIRSETLKRYRVKLYIYYWYNDNSRDVRDTTHVVWASCVDNAIARAKQKEMDHLMPGEKFGTTETQMLDY